MSASRGGAGCSCRFSAPLLQRSLRFSRCWSWCEPVLTGIRVRRVPEHRWRSQPSIGSGRRRCRATPLPQWGLSAAGQYATYHQTGAHGTVTSVTLIGIQPTQQQLAAITALTPVQVGAANGRSGALSDAGLAPTGRAVFWPLDGNRWIGITKYSDDANGLAVLVQPSGRRQTITSPS